MNTKHLRVKRIGSISELDLEIRAVNVFIGPQSTGKSTLAKIISQALWAEKNFLTMGDRYDFYRGLIDFHNMDASCFVDRSLEIVYDSPWCSIRMAYKEGKRYPHTEYIRKASKAIYRNAKIEYIPAERNFVSSIGGIQRYNESYDSKVSFLHDWEQCKVKYQRGKRFEVSLPELSFSYRYHESEGRDIVRLSTGEELRLQASSSGQQSLLPLLVVAQAVMQDIYMDKRMFNPAELAHIRKKAPNQEALIDLLGKIGKKQSKSLNKQLQALWQDIGYDARYGCTHLIIEEPEQNLYPSTQRGLVHLLLDLLGSGKASDHSLTLTTHSPYILYALDNAMLAGLLQARGKSLEGLELRRGIDPKEVSLYLMKEGGLVSLQGEDGLLGQNNIFDEEFRHQHELMYSLLLRMHQEHDTEPTTEG